MIVYRAAPGGNTHVLWVVISFALTRPVTFLLW